MFKIFKKKLTQEELHSEILKYAMTVKDMFENAEFEKGDSLNLEQREIHFFVLWIVILHLKNYDDIFRDSFVNNYLTNIGMSEDEKELFYGEIKQRWSYYYHIFELYMNKSLSGEQFGIALGNALKYKKFDMSFIQRMIEKKVKPSDIGDDSTSPPESVLLVFCFSDAMQLGDRLNKQLRN